MRFRASSVRCADPRVHLSDLRVHSCRNTQTRAMFNTWTPLRDVARPELFALPAGSVTPGGVVQFVFSRPWDIRLEQRLGNPVDVEVVPCLAACASSSSAGQVHMLEQQRRDRQLRQERDQVGAWDGSTSVFIGRADNLEVQTVPTPLSGRDRGHLVVGSVWWGCLHKTLIS
jgi:hypothetical protein